MKKHRPLAGRTTIRMALLLRLILAAGILLSLSLPLLAQKRAQARGQYERAEKLRTALDGKPQKLRTEKEYLQAIQTYRRVYLITPHAAEVTNALVSVAELYQEMGRQFDPKYFRSAVDAYQFLLHEYPTSRFRDDALFTIAQIQHKDLGDLETAQKSLEEFLKRYPRSAKAEQARAALAEIAADREKERQAATRQSAAEERARSRQIPQVTSIRHWNGENYTRVVVAVEKEVRYKAERIGNPDRIYFDVYKAQLSSTLSGKTLEVEDGFLKSIRVAQNQEGVVRVVLDVSKVKDYSIFYLPNPDRLVVDVFGETPAAARPERAAAPRGTEASAPSAPEKASTKESSTIVAAAHAEPPPAKTSGSGAAAEPPSKEKVEPGPPPKGEKQQPVAASEKPAERAAASQPAVGAPQPMRSGQISMTRALGLKIGRIVIDPGHGGHDTGTIGPTGLMEKDLCLDVAMRLGRMIQEKLPGAEILYTREDDTFVPLEQRTAIANQAKADLFISVHANSSRDHRARGIETFYLSFAASDDALEVAARENALSQSSIHELQDLLKKIARNEKIDESRELAREIQENLSKRMQRVSKYNRSRGVKKAPFVVLIGANMPSVLTEISFLSNPSDEALLKKGEHRQRVAEGIYKGIESYLQNLNSLSYNRTAQSESAR
jgi:N-acetylmuramoyl-L-alanine amidase